MPWYWSDEIAAFLTSQGHADPGLAAKLTGPPVAYRSDLPTLEEAAIDFSDDEEVPLAA